MSGQVQTDGRVFRCTVFTGALAIVGLLGVLDYETGRDLAISAFYLIPICGCTWLVGRNAGVVLSLISAACWLVGDLWMNFSYPYAALPYWNALMLLALFWPTVYLLSEFQSSHRTLEKMVEIRTAALRHEMDERKRMEAAKIQAERLAIVGTMAAQVAHEVRNPLGAITLNLDLIEGEIEQAHLPNGKPLIEGSVLVDEMRDEVRRIDKVISDYLSIARPRTSQKEAVSLKALIERKLGLVHELLSQARVNPEINLEAESIIQGNGDQLWQAILNLIKNSVEAMPNGGRLSLETRRTGDQVKLIVRDSGEGLTEAQKEKLFVPFATTKAQGTGLGLPMVHQIVNEHGGTIVCRSELGRGTEFTMTFPQFRQTESRNPASRIPEVSIST